jgi:hypothetical protein
MGIVDWWFVPTVFIKGLKLVPVAPNLTPADLREAREMINNYDYLQRIEYPSFFYCLETDYIF